MNDKAKKKAEAAALEYVLLKAWYMVEDGSISFPDWLEGMAKDDYGIFWKEEAQWLLRYYENS